MESKINTIEEAFIAEGLSIKKLPVVTHLENVTDQEAVISGYMLDVVIRALNNEGQEEKWVANYSDREQIKYENWYECSPSSGWSLGDVDAWCTYTFSGSRRAFRTRAIGHHLWEKFSDLIKETL